MKVLKRSGELEDVSLDKISKRIRDLSGDLNKEYIDPIQIAIKVTQGLYEGISTEKLDDLAAEVCASLVTRHPDYALLASRIAVSNLHKNTLKSFSQTAKKLYKYINPKTGKAAPLLSDEVYEIIQENADLLDSSIIYDRDFDFDYFGFKTLEKSYLFKLNNQIVERPQHMFMRVAIGIHKRDIENVLQTYEMLSERWFTHATPTLFNAGTPKPQMSSCFLLDIKDDSIEGIYETLKQTALISQSAGGIGLAVSKIRSQGSYIAGTNGTSNGLVPMLQVFNYTARYVDQGGGKRKGAFAIYLEPWHSDVFDFLNLRKTHGKEELRARDLFLALWTPDLFMKRVEEDGIWSLFSPNEAVGLTETWGDKFEELYCKYESEGKAVKTIKARELWDAILDAQIETGNPFMLYKDAANRKSNQQNLGTIKSSNLCITGDQRVVTSDGIFKAKDLNINGKLLKLFNGNKEVLSSQMKLRGKNQDVFKITLENGMEHKVTSDHGLPSLDKFNNISRVECKDLKVGDKLAIQTKKGLFGSKDEKDAAYLLGLYQSDGTQSGNSIHLDIWEKDFDLLPSIEEKVHRLYKELGYKPRYSTKGGYFRDQKTGFSKIKKKRLTTEFFKSQYNFEKGYIPEWIWQGTEQTQWEYLKGLLQADGTVFISKAKGNPIQISYSDISLDFLKELQILLQNLGLQTSIRLLHEKGEKKLPDGKGGYKIYNVKDCYRLIIGNKNDALEIERYTGFLSRKGVKLENKNYRDNTKKGYKVKSIDYIGKEDVYCPTVFNEEHIFICQGMKTFNCTEIIEYTDPNEVAVCNLASIALPKFVEGNTFNFQRLYNVAYQTTFNLNRVIDNNYYPVPEAESSNKRHRPIGIGVQGLADAFLLLKYPFESEQAKILNRDIFETIYFAAMTASKDLAKEEGAYSTFQGSPLSEGKFQFDLWNVEPTNRWDWNTLRNEVMEFGVRNSLLLAPMPTASTSQILGNNECFEPYTTNIYTRRVLSGEFIMVNKHLINDLISLGLWNNEVRNAIIANNGSVQSLNIPQYLKDLYKTVWEIKQKAIIDMAADRGAYICQSQSMNLFIESPTTSKLTSMHFYAWKKGLKTGMYYLRTQAATQAVQFTVEKEVKTEDTPQGVVCRMEEGCVTCGS